MELFPYCASLKIKLIIHQIGRDYVQGSVFMLYLTSATRRLGLGTKVLQNITPYRFVASFLLEEDLGTHRSLVSFRGI